MIYIGTLCDVTPCIHACSMCGSLCFGPVTPFPTNRHQPSVSGKSSYPRLRELHDW